MGTLVLVKIIIILLALTLVACSESKSEKASREELFRIITPESTYKFVLFDGPVMREAVLGKAMHACLGKGKKLFNVGSYEDEQIYQLIFDNGYVIRLKAHNGLVFQYYVMKKDGLIYRNVVPISSANCPINILN